MLLKNKKFQLENSRNFLSPKKNPLRLCYDWFTRVFFWESKNHCKNSQSFLIDKKGLSEIVGYVLLILFVIIISIAVYQWLKSYVPEEALKCPEETSILIKEMTCSQLLRSGPTQKEINITLKNSGNFNIDGYFVKATETEEQKIGTKDLSIFFNLAVSESAGVANSAIPHGNSLRFYTALEPNDEKTAVFHVPNSEEVSIHSIEIIPFRFQKFKNKNRFVTCGDAKVLQKLGC